MQNFAFEVRCERTHAKLVILEGDIADARSENVDLGTRGY